MRSQMNRGKLAQQQTVIRTSLRFIVDVEQRSRSHGVNGGPSLIFILSLSLSFLWQNEAIWIYRNKKNPQSREAYIRPMWKHTHKQGVRGCGSEDSLNFQHHRQRQSAGTLMLCLYVISFFSFSCI